MNSFTRLSVCVAVAVSALFAAGCPKKPLRPNPSQTAIGSGQGGYLDPNAVSMDPSLNLENRGGTDALRGRRGVLPNVYFDFDSAAIRAAERAKLTQAVDFLNQNPNARLLLEGHCDWRGTAEYNLGLGDRRANAVKQYLGTLGVSASRLELVSVGDNGATEGGSEAQMQEDRRVELAILD